MPEAISPQVDSSSSLFQTLLKNAKDVAIDPTTYAPAGITYGAMKSDWDTSQPLFAKGYMEANPKFTQSGLPNSTPLSYSDGMAAIRGRALGNLAKQAGNNALVNLLTQRLTSRFPDHEKLIKGLGWAEKAGVSGLSSYLGSANHLSQVGKNKQMMQGF